MCKNKFVDHNGQSETRITQKNHDGLYVNEAHAVLYSFTCLRLIIYSTHFGLDFAQNQYHTYTRAHNRKIQETNTKEIKNESYSSSSIDSGSIKAVHRTMPKQM